MAMHANSVSEILCAHSDMKLQSTIGFGCAGAEANENTAHLGRISVEESVTFHS
jgi:4-aminobutyrate aminotransferase-like enzyme